MKVTDRPGLTLPGEAGFPRDHRLTTEHDFRRVFAQPEVSQDRAFRVLSRKNGLAHARLGMAVSTKVCRQATGRNRLKRLIRESFRHHCTQLSAQGGLDLVVLPSRQAATMCNRALSAALVRHWRHSARRYQRQASTDTAGPGRNL